MNLTRLAILLCVLSTAHGGPSIPNDVAAVEIRDRELQVIRTLQKRTEVEHLISIANRAAEVRTGSLRDHFTHTINMPHRWLYDQQTGELVLLSKAPQPIFRVGKDEKMEFDSLISKGSNQSPQTTPVSAPR